MAKKDHPTDEEENGITLTRNQKRIRDQIKKEQTQETLAQQVTENIQTLLKDNNVYDDIFKNIFREAINDFLENKLKKSREREENESDEEALIKNIFTKQPKLNNDKNEHQEIKIQFIDINKMLKQHRYNNMDYEEDLGEEDTEEDYDEDEYEDEEDYDEEEDGDEDKSSQTTIRKKTKIVVKQNPQYKYYLPREMNYFQKLPSELQQKITDQEKTFFKKEDSVPYRFKILLSDLDESVKKVALKKIEHLQNLRPDNGEFAKLSNYIDQICNLPVGKYRIPHTLEVSQNPSKIKEYLTDTQKILDEKIYGHKETKEQIIRLLAQWITNPSSKGQILGLLGKPGCGKTFLIKNVLSQIMGLPHIFIPVGGLTDASSLVGHSYTYEGSIPGMIVQQLTQIQCMNPIIIFDELDKVSESQHGKEIIGILTHLTDQTQNDNFHDKYFANIKFDLSRALMIFTYNDEALIDPILRDRITQITCKEYDTNDKVEIAEFHLIPELLQKYNIELEPNQKVSDFLPKEIVKKIISQTKQEYGVRQLKQNLDLIIGEYNLERLINPDCKTISTEFVEKILRKKGTQQNHSYLRMYV